jgi:motility quorum-sensing regulator/GCU-specific mRNA interferase toxin
MEKRIPHYDLKTIQTMLHDESLRLITKTSRQGAVSLGYVTEEEMIGVVDLLHQGHFDKSMTTIGDTKLWQDVYKIADGQNNVYIKLQLSANKSSAVLVEFKEDTGTGGIR